MTNSGVAKPPIHAESGQILILTAVAMLALLGIAALSLDASYMYDLRNRMHAAADAAAKSAAIELVRTGANQSTLEAFADQQVAWQGFTPSRLGGTTSVVVNHAPSSSTCGTFCGDVNYVEVIVSETKPTFFANILGIASMTPRASAIAGSGNPANCVIVNQDLDIGNSTLTTNGCGVAVGHNLDGQNPGSTINGTPTPSVAVTGVCLDTCTNMGSLTTGAPTPTDPLAGLAVPTNPGGCVPGVAAVLAPGCYTSIATSVTTLSGGGVYYVTGPINIGNNLSLTGSNAMLFLTGSAQLVAGNNASIHLTAQTSGTYKGIAFFQDVGDANDLNTGNSFLVDVTGAIYMPGTDVHIRNHLQSTSTTCTLFIARSVTIENGAGLFATNSGCASTFGGALFLSVSIAQ